MTSKRTVIISSELTSFIGRGACDLSALPAAPLILGFGDIGEPAVSVMTPRALDSDDLVILAISRAACRRMFGLVPKAGGRWYLPADLRGVGRAVMAVEGDGEAATLLRTARSLELLCQLFDSLKAGRMVEARGKTTLSEREIALVAAAHELVLEGWQDKLTVDGIARRFGLGKAKLTQGFHELYRCTVAEAVSISPAGGNFTGDYQVKFDMWINANGPFPGGGGGSTEFFTAGVGTTGDHLQWASANAASNMPAGCSPKATCRLPSSAIVAVIRAMRASLAPSPAVSGWRRPNYAAARTSAKVQHKANGLAGAAGLEPATLGFGDRCSTN